MSPKAHHSYYVIRMGIIKEFIVKSISLSPLGDTWVGKLLSYLKYAAFGNSYVETVDPSQTDTLHRYIKNSDEKIFKKQFELCVKQVLKGMKLSKVKVAFDVTTDLYWGKFGFENTRSVAYKKSDETWQFLTLAIVEPKFIPLMSLPYKQTDDLVIDLLEYLKTLPLKIKLILFDRGFYHWNLIDYLKGQKSGYSWPYLIFVPKNKIVKDFIEQTEEKIGVFKHQGKYTKEGSTWKSETTIVILKGATKNKNGELLDWCFATNQKPSVNLIT